MLTKYEGELGHTESDESGLRHTRDTSNVGEFCFKNSSGQNIANLTSESFLSCHFFILSICYLTVYISENPKPSPFFYSHKHTSLCTKSHVYYISVIHTFFYEQTPIFHDEICVLTMFRGHEWFHLGKNLHLPSQSPRYSSLFPTSPLTYARLLEWRESPYFQRSVLTFPVSFYKVWRELASHKIKCNLHKMWGRREPGR